MITIYKDECFLNHSDISVSNYRYNKRSDEHRHSFFELAYIAEGAGFHIIDGRSIPVMHGDYFLLDAKMSHCYDGNISVINLTFKPSFLDKNYRDIVTISQFYDRITYQKDYSLSVSEPLYHTFHDNGEVLKRIEYIKKEIEQKRFGYEECVRIALSEIILYTVRSAICKDKTDDNIQYIKTYIYEHYSENINLTKLSSKLGYSVPYISKQFRAATGRTFSEYLQSTRIKFACNLFTNNPKIHISEAAAIVGYRDMKRFTAVFKKITGTTPRNFCKTLKE